MIHKILICCTLFILVYACSGEKSSNAEKSNNPHSGQTNYLDSLYWEINNTSNDTIKYDAYTALFEAYVFSDLKIARNYLDTMESIALENSSNYFNGRFLLSKGDLLDFEGKVEESEIAYLESVKLLTKTNASTDLGTALNNLGYVQNHLGKFNEAIKTYESAIEVRTNSKDTARMSSSYNNLGYVYDLQGDATRALKNYHISLALREKINDKYGIAQSLNNIAFVYQTKGNISKAVDYFQKAIRYFEEINDTNGISVCYNNIGILYQHQEDYDEALAHYEKSLQLIENSNDKESIARTQSNIAYIHLKKGDYKKSRAYYNESLKFLRLHGDKLSVAGSLVSIGNSIVESGSDENPFNFFNEALTIYNYLDNQKGTAEVYLGLSQFYYNKKNFKKSEEYALMADHINRELDFPEDRKESTKMLYMVYKEKRNFEKALKNHEAYLGLKEAIQNESNKNAVLNSKFQIEYERQSAKDSVSAEAKRKLLEIQHKSELTDEKNKRFLLFGGLGFLILIAVLLIIAYQRKKKDNRIIEQQKEEVEEQRDQAKKAQFFAEEQKLIVEEKNKEILDSIQYAKRLQNAILPAVGTIKENFSEAFILYHPKDIVAGDFYWFENLAKEKIKFIAVADCTGHGVPGAMVSVVCSNALSKAVLEEGLRKPSAILERVKDIVIKTFAKSEESINDGMDIALCKIEEGKKTLEYSGANISLIQIIESGDKDIPFKLERWKPTKRPVGLYKIDVPFENHSITLNQNDRFYMYSDGYADQFGGQDHHISKQAGKKLKSSNLRKLILSIQDQKLDDQKDFLVEKFDQWKGDIEQIDDVCVIGFRV